MTKWKPAKKVPMLGNGIRHQLGIPAVVPVIVKWGLPWLLTAGGIAVTSLVASKSIPEVPINKKNIAVASALAGAGLTSFFLSDTIPDGWKPVAYAAAVAGIAGGAYFLFKEPALLPVPDIIPSKRVAPESQVPPWAPGQLLEAFTVFVDPDQPNTGGSRRWLYGDQNYEVIVKNESNTPITFFVGAEVYTAGATRLYRSPGPSDVKYGRKKVTLAPSNQEGNDKRVIVTVPELKGTWWESGYSNGIGVNFEFFRQGDDNAAFKVSESMPIHFSLFPIG